MSGGHPYYWAFSCPRDHRNVADMIPLRLASFQRQPNFNDVPGTVERLLADLRWCDDRDIHLAVFPECYLQGYSRDRQVLRQRALALDSDAFGEVLATLASIRCTIVLGVIERRRSGLYNTAAVIRSGKLLGTYSKTHPNEEAFEAGSNYPVFNILGWSFGINICNDANFPDAALRLSRQGARILCYPLNNMLRPRNADEWRKKSIENLKQIAATTGCWVVSSDVVGRHDDLVSYGCTCIVSPDGQVVERADEGHEGIVSFDLA